MKTVRRAAALCLCLGFVVHAWAADPTWEFAVQASATVQASPPQIRLSWPQDTFATPSSYSVFRKSPTSTSWGTPTVLPGTATTFTDNNVTGGTVYEYQIFKTNTTYKYSGYGYVLSGINAPLVESRGKIVLIVDNTYAADLASELNRLQQDLTGDGWTVLRHNVARNESVVNVRNLIRNQYNTDPSNVKAVFLFGHVPVSYSGNFAGDFHAPEHQGAWPADAYYGDMNGTWTDSAVSNTNAEYPRNWNVPGDGKFDQSYLPSPLELVVGRVDLADLPAFAQGEKELLRQYLNKNHNYRHKLMTANLRGLIHDSSGTRDGEAFAASGWRNFAPWFGAANITTVPVGQWFSTLHNQSYLWAYGCGGASFFSIAGLGTSGNYNEVNTWDFAAGDPRAVFYMFAGSWLGDWDSQNNIMRATLATRTFGLACVVGGQPHWYGHQMGLGETIGHCTRLTQNNPPNGLYRNQVDDAAGLVHEALMGDPTLRLHMVAPPPWLTGTMTSGGANLGWGASPESVAGYHVYRANSANGPFVRVSTSLVGGTSFTDTSVSSGTYTYMVRAVKLENRPSGSYFNASQGVFATVSGSGSSDTIPPTIAMTAPANGATVSGSSVTVSANASDNISVVGVQFKLDGANLGAEDTASPYSIVWNTTATGNGSHTLTAVARDGAGNQTTSSPVTVTVNNGTSSTTVWIDDSLPAGASPSSSGGDSWTWASNNPSPFSGVLAHQSAIAAGMHQHFFENATAALTVNSGDTLFAYVYLDPSNPPNEVMLQWNDGSWEHRAYWGADNIGWGVNGSASRYFAGALPPAGQWVRLAVPAAAVGLEGKTLNGMAFTLYGGRATWDYAGRDSSGSPPPPPPLPPPPSSEVVWVEDSLPSGAIADYQGGDAWAWAGSNPTPFSGSLAHQSAIAAGTHQHYFYNASVTLTVSVGDSLFAYVHLDPANPPSEIMLQWNENGSWEHRAYWGANNIPWGINNTASRFFAGSLPAAGQWVRLEVPASAVGLEGKTLNGMAFTLYNGRATWDRAGKASP
ncbi:MAG: Ig-like domain-containing protein [Verrucomicrobiota bacterium]